MDAARNTNTSVVDYLDMPIGRFLDIWEALCRVSERNAKEMEELRSRR